MKQITKIVFSLAVLVFVSGAQAAVTKDDTLVYISPTHYQHSVRLLHPFYNYWFEQGPLVEPIALKALQASHANLSLCHSGQKAETIVSIEPRIFYNPQMRVYHSELIATVYSGGGTKVGTYVGHAQQQGNMSVDHGLQGHIQQAYRSAMDDLMGKIKLAQHGATGTEVKLPCNVVGAQYQPNISYY
jgi:hypothetical protein